MYNTSLTLTQGYHSNRPHTQKTTNPLPSFFPSRNTATIDWSQMNYNTNLSAKYY